MLWLTTRTVIATSTSRRWHSGYVMRLRCPGRLDASRCVYFRVMCIGNPPKPAPYLRQTTSARLESSPCILSDQPDSEEQSDQPDSEEQSDQIDTRLHGGNLTPDHCWKTSSSMIGTELPRTSVRKQWLQRRNTTCHESRPRAKSGSLSYTGSLLGCVKIVKQKHDRLPNVHAL